MATDLELHRTEATPKSLNFAEALGARAVFGDPIQQDGVTVIPASLVQGGGGGGVQGGFGGRARPVGAVIIEKGQARWLATPDVTRLLAVAGVALALVVALKLFRRRRRARKAAKLEQRGRR